MIRHSLFLAWQYLRWHRARAIVLISALTILICIPLSMRAILDHTETRLSARAQTTPLILGSRASALDLAMNSLYFSAQRPPTITFADAKRLRDSHLTRVIPLHVQFSAQDKPLVGTTVDYFSSRDLWLAAGSFFALPGEAVLGSRAASALQIEPGHTLNTDTESGFDIAGVYPLRLEITGVLAPSGTADDNAVFVDLKTAWIIAGLGHGHEQISRANDPGVVLSEQDGVSNANAALPLHQRISPENEAEFHFHGDISDYPLSAALAWPKDDRASTLLRGRFIDNAQRELIVPADVVNELVKQLIELKKLFDGIVISLAVVVLLLLCLVYHLSLRLRASEFRLQDALGTPVFARVWMIAMELLIVLGAAVGLSLVIAMVVGSQSEQLVLLWLSKS